MNTSLTPCIMQTAIICATIVIIVAIVASAYKVNKQQRVFGTYIYWASVLALLAIAIFSYAFYGNGKVLDFVSLASALISIILAVITIIYSFYSNSRSAGQVETLNHAADSVKKATESYSKSAISLHENISRIILAVDRVEEKTDKLLDMAISSPTERKNESLVVGNFDIGAYAEGYIRASSPMGNLAIYACVRASDANKEWNLKLFERDSHQTYCSGFLIATISAGFISATIDFDSNSVKVREYLSPIKQSVVAWVDDFDFSHLPELKDIKKRIDEYFGESI